MKNKNSGLFICSKPIQLIIQNAVVSSLPSSHNSVDLWLVGKFYKSEELYEELKKNKSCWKNISYFKTLYAAYKSLLTTCEYKQIYIDSDFGTVNIVLALCKLFGRDIYVVEEGIGIYNKDLLKSFDKTTGIIYLLKRLFFKIIGSGLYFGNSKWVKGIYVFDKMKYENIHLTYKKKVIEIPRSLKQEIYNKLDYYERIFNLQDVVSTIKVTNVDCVTIYSASYHIRDYRQFIDDDEFFIIKMHPGYNNYSQFEKIDGNVILLKNSAPTEVLVFLIGAFKKRVKVLHENSSVGNYLFKEKGIKVINLFERK
ncbi:polysialyltransferase family glycosyltransferase [Marinilabilia rubra]|uniref:Uncharacterized protein n=1 Tax=Marinilabilia rubra TaxID=2162893 RepID=A0A2U2B3S5_9BACT|nr:hypothetical protein [Marinilabilia rubra]PWD97687.1 hypothetical protein DDZ16_19545 [Marinilabilia rubra]